ncbi:hypothetical protein [Diaphorobacter nitroreducens]|uniref:hypothetical protein n=1 Tax=Diaphorobacter nitroreducens TaxID=164759 RepID=UPI000B59BD05|nr:hypothetical protein [Diaphorobacter nitroreducens]
MTILEQDLKLLASRVMADVPDGGRGPTGTEIPYGGSNAVFTDVTEADRAGGNVSIRQLHMGVLTPNTETLMGPSVILSALPTDASVSVTLAKCGLFARRSEIAAAIASYLIEGVPWSAVLLEDHVIGMRSLQLFHRPGTPAPDINRTLVLAYQAGTVNERIQFVRVTGTSTEARTFTYLVNGTYVDYQGSVTKVDLSDTLRYAFPGSSPARDFSVGSGKTIVRDTTVADAAVYYGASTLTAAASLGDTQLRVASIYSQIVPNSRTEVTALDQYPAATRTVVLAESPRRIEVPVAAHTQRIKIGQSNRGFSFVAMLRPLPDAGSVTISYRALGNWYTLSDDGQGVLSGYGSGRVIYTTGSLDMTLQALPDDGSSIIIQWAEKVGYTDRTGQGAQVRAPEYSFSLQQMGYERGTLVITWTSGGVLRTATATAGGKFTGDADGEVDAPSGTVYLRPKHMIDAGGQFSLAYDTSTQQTEILSVPALDAGGFGLLTLAQQPVAGTLDISWATVQEVTTSSGGHLNSESSNKSADSKVISSRIYSTEWATHLSAVGAPIVKPINGSWASVTYTSQRSDSSSSVYNRTSSQEEANKLITLHTVSDDGVGAFIGGMGTVNYTGKQISLRMVTAGRSVTSYKSDYVNASEFEATTSGQPSSGGATSRGGDYSTTTMGESMLAGTSVVARYKVGTSTPVHVVETYTPPDVTIDLCPYTQHRIVPGSVAFTWMGVDYQDFEGTLYRGRTASSPGIASGTVDYAAGLALLSDYVVSGSPTAFTLTSLWTRHAPWSTASVFFRTQSSPIKPGGITLLLVDLAGAALTAVADNAGNFTGTHMRGRMDFEHGVGELQFGDYVLDSALTAAEKAEWWYDAADVGAVEVGKIWRPWPVDPTTLRYNSVAFFYLPLDADILGLDPVRLPPDGRVPVFRVGSYVVIGHTGVVAAANYANGASINTGRTRLSRVYLVNALGQLITGGYTVDLDAGLISVVDTTGWVQPVTVKHRIEQMLRLSDVQIDGRLQLTGQLSHDFPPGSVVSSAIMTGNLAARALPVFDQQSWDGVTWSDGAIGSPASATYNDGAYPVGVTNEGTMTERFALRVLTGGTDVEVIGEHVGNLGTFSRNAAIAPINPVSNAPYFTLAPAGWGNGWAAGNVLFVHTVGTYYPFAAIRAVQPGPAPIGTDYAFDITLRGDVDRAPVAPVI